jgi:hypothetical protein
VHAASELLKRYDPRLMRCYRISTRINYVANDDGDARDPNSRGVPRRRIDECLRRLAVVYVLSGKRTEAVKLLNQMRELNKKHRVEAYNLWIHGAFLLLGCILICWKFLRG